jgi:hypothetical protein
VPLPLFTGEASLYRMRQAYRGYTGAAGGKATTSVSAGIPGFTSTASLYPSSSYGRGITRQVVNPTWLTAAQDNRQQCINDCMEACTSAGGLGRECAAQCRQECGRVPGGGGGGGTGGGGTGPLPTCTSGAQCYTPELGVTCNCPPGKTCLSICTTSRDCQVNPLLCALFPLFGCIPQCEVTRLCSVDMFCQ